MMFAASADLFYTESWLSLIDFLQTSQATATVVEVFLYAKSGSIKDLIKRFPACSRKLPRV